MKAHVSILLSRAIAGAILLIAILTAAPRTLAQPPAETTAPAWTLRDLAGKPVNSDQFKGKVVVIDFWATWCPPCRKEIPGFVDLHRRYADKGLVIVGIALDRMGPSAIKTFVEKFGMKYPVVIGDARIAETFGGIEAIPTTFVIDRTGKIVGKHVGYEGRETFEKEIKPLL
jgi:thiol-disulfide isomerase/thioredoxin